MTRRPILLLLLIGALGACGDDSKEAAVSTTSAPQSTIPRAASASGGISDAAKSRDDLLAATAAAVKGKDLSKANKVATDAVVAAWQGRLPGVVVSGIAVESKAGPPPGISSSLVGGISTVNSKNVPGPTNPYQVAFVVKDVAGKCAGGSLRGFPLPTQEKRFDVTGPCNLAAVPAASLG